jgi:hypothetical protein
VNEVTMGVPNAREITSAERIRRIIGILRLDGRELELHFPRYIEVGRITDATGDIFKVRLSGPLPDQSVEEGSVPITFVFSGVELFGRCRIINRDASSVTLDYPDALMGRSKRRFPRIRMGREVPARVKVKQYPERRAAALSSRELPVQYSKLYWEVQRESVDIKRVFLLAGAEIKKISPHARIVLYHKDNLATRDARILRRSGKVLYVEDCRKVPSYTRFVPSDKIISYSYHLNEERGRGTGRQELIEELKSIIRENLEQGYSSKALVPIFSGDEVIGHILGAHKEPERKITYDDTAALMSLSALLTMGIERAGFVPDLGDVMPGSVVDISEGGVLLELGMDRDPASLAEGADIEARFILDGRDVSLKGTVARIDASHHRFAIQFTEVQAADRQYIKQFVEAGIEKMRR